MKPAVPWQVREAANVWSWCGSGIRCGGRCGRSAWPCWPTWPPYVTPARRYHEDSRASAARHPGHGREPGNRRWGRRASRRASR